MDKLSKENERKLFLAIELIDKIFDVGSKILERFVNGEYKLVVFVFINFLENRFNNKGQSFRLPLTKKYAICSPYRTNIELFWRRFKDFSSD